MLQIVSLLFHGEKVLLSSGPTGAHMPLPNLSGVIQPQDVKQKGKGSFAADYVSWAKTMYYINKHAPGWLPAFKANDDGSLVRQAPNGTGYVICYFWNVEEAKVTPDWHYAVTDNQNRPIPYDRISSVDICNATRRGLCSCAAEVFSLGYELWAREEINESTPDSPQVTAGDSGKHQKEKAAELPGKSESELRDEELEAQLCDRLQTLKKEDCKTFLEAKQKKWKLANGGSRVRQMSNAQMRECLDELNG